ncbi:hypothetical protein [Virgisporangium aurantiacum]|uniref:Uncharacterized protein n=1 Tax=Virgisporangium aurantiacum TaxID=175570 RepID=A0A8J4E1R1_9ACTN|nr:hypothetical protein [Virgisporangium aurantiacum]GIJ58269.1 hypothetical protein Vau01_057850 [Virgisporangium aurantiacum]
MTAAGEMGAGELGGAELGGAKMRGGEMSGGGATGEAVGGAGRGVSGGVTGGTLRGGTGADLRAGALERRYRRLLLAYPRAYRRRHGAEILTTLMDAAGPGRDRPAGREVRNLLAGGLRQRFRLPVGRTMIAVAVLSALVVGALGSAAGSALGWATAPALPTDSTLGRVVGVALGQPAHQDIEGDGQLFGLRQRAMMGMVVPVGWSADEARARLAAEGWRVGPIQTRETTVHYADDGTTLPADTLTFVAVRDGTEIMVTGVMERRYSPQVMVMVQQTEPWSVLPLTLAGLIAGLLAGWLLAARIGYRVRRLSAWRQMPPVTAATVAAAALGLSALTTFRAVGAMVTDAAGTDPLSPDRFGSFPAFSAYYFDSSVDPVALTGFGALALLLVLAYAVPAETEPARIRG